MHKILNWVVNPLMTTLCIYGAEFWEFFVSLPVNQFEKFFLYSLPPGQTFGAKPSPSPTQVTFNSCIAQSLVRAVTCVLTIGTYFVIYFGKVPCKIKNLNLALYRPYVSNAHLKIFIFTLVLKE